MEKKLFRNSISALIIAVMAVTAFAVPILFDGDKAFAESSPAADAQIITDGDALSDITADLKNTDNAVKPKGIAPMAAVANPNGNYARIPSNIINGRAFTVSFVGSRQNAALLPAAEGDEMYLPYYCTLSLPGYSPGIWYFGTHSGGNFNFYNPPYSIKFTTYYIGKYSMNVVFTKLVYTGGAWTAQGNITKPYTINSKGYVSFNKNKGKFKKRAKQKTVSKGSRYGTLPKMKKRKGYSFAGWYTAKNAGKKVTSKSTVTLTKNATFYAQWKYKVNLNANGGKKVKAKSVTSGKKYGSLKATSRSGNNFAGWFTKKKGGSWISKSNYVGASKHTLYAHWVKKNRYATKSMYKAVKGGMAYKDCKRIFGHSSDESTIDNYGRTWKIWHAKKNAVNNGRPIHTGPIIIMSNGKAIYKGWFNGSYATLKPLNSNSTNSLSADEVMDNIGELFEVE